MVCHTEIISAIVYVWLGAVLGTYNPFVDNIPFSIAWQGPELPLVSGWLCWYTYSPYMTLGLDIDGLPKTLH